LHLCRCDKYQTTAQRNKKRTRTLSQLPPPPVKRRHNPHKNKNKNNNNVAQKVQKRKQETSCYQQIAKAETPEEREARLAPFREQARLRMQNLRDKRRRDQQQQQQQQQQSKREPVRREIVSDKNQQEEEFGRLEDHSKKIIQTAASIPRAPAVAAVVAAAFPSPSETNKSGPFVSKALTSSSEVTLPSTNGETECGPKSSLSTGKWTDDERDRLLAALVSEVDTESLRRAVGTRRISQIRMYAFRHFPDKWTVFAKNMANARAQNGCGNIQQQQQRQQQQASPDVDGNAKASKYNRPSVASKSRIPKVILPSKVSTYIPTVHKGMMQTTTALPLRKALTTTTSSSSKAQAVELSRQKVVKLVPAYMSYRDNTPPNDLDLQQVKSFSQESTKQLPILHPGNISYELSRQTVETFQRGLCHTADAATRRDIFALNVEEGTEYCPIRTGSRDTVEEKSGMWFQSAHAWTTTTNNNNTKNVRPSNSDTSSSKTNEDDNEVSMAHWSGIGIPKTNAIALEVSYTHTHDDDDDDDEKKKMEELKQRGKTGMLTTQVSSWVSELF